MPGAAVAGTCRTGGLGRSQNGHPGWTADYTLSDPRSTLRETIGVYTMIGDILYPSNAAVFGRVLGDVKQAIQIDLRLPDWPFRAPVGNVDICQFSLAIEGPFGKVLQSLADTHQDSSISLATLEPNPEYYRDNYGSYPAFTVTVSREWVAW